MSGPFTEGGQVILDGSGNGTIRLSQPRTYHSRRYIRMTASISTGEASIGGEVRCYAGEALPGNFIDGSETPWLDTATWSPEQAVIHSPLQLVAVFTSCDPAATARLDTTYMED
jgi:hypothetical protein